MSAKPPRRNPEGEANPISRLFFWWTFELFRKGMKRDLSVNDLYDPPSPDESERVGDRLEAAWNKELEKLNTVECRVDNRGSKVPTEKPSLLKALIRTFWVNYIGSNISIVVYMLILRTLQPMLQGAVISYFSMGRGVQTEEEALYYATGLVVAIVVGVFLTHHATLQTQRLGMRIRVACSSLIYRKSLRLSKTSLDKASAGQVVNLLSNDVGRFEMLPMYLCYLWFMPIQIVLLSSIIWHRIGVSTLAGIGSLLLIAIPFQGYISWLSGRLREIIAKLTDRRVQLMNELIAGIQVIKTYAWEKPFNRVVSQTRRDEIKKITLANYCKGLYASLIVVTERLTLFLSIVSYVLMHNKVTAELTFELFSFFNILQFLASYLFPTALIMAGEARISIQRIQEFLLLDEIDYTLENTRTNAPVKKVDPTKTPVFVELHQVSANWVSGQLPPTVCNVSMKIKGGQLCTLVGTVGSGKSSLLSILLNELPVGAGSVGLYQHSGGQFPEAKPLRGFFKDNLEMKISFASQDAWLFSATLRENILFGQPFDKTRYEEVTKVCALLRDFKQLPNGDMTIVGDRGTALSGGQRARVNLARAIYRQADLYLLDDPLSAVDSRVARRLFKDCIVDFLKDKTRILVTHQLHFLKRANTIVVLEKGSVKYQGTFDELTSSNNDFNDMLHQLKEKDQKAETKHETADIADGLQAIEETDSYHGNSIREENAKWARESLRRRSGRSSVRSLESYCFDDDYEAAAANSRTKAEVMLSGQMSSTVYTRYFQSGSGIFKLALLVAVFVLGQVATSGADYWLSYWMNIEVVRDTLNDSIGNNTIAHSGYLRVVNDSFLNYFSLLDENGLLPTDYAIYIYTLCLCFCLIFINARSVLFMRTCMDASTTLHNVMFSNLLHSTMYFFNTNPSGRILNRFSKDTGTMDEILPKTILEFAQISLVALSILTMITIVNYWMIIPILVMGVAAYVARNVYLNTAQDIKRLEGIAKSPVFSHVAATMNGLATIRSRGTDVQLMMRKEFDNYQDTHTSVFYMIIATGSAFGLAMDLISSVFIACVCYSLILIGTGNVMSGSVGLALSQSLILTGMLQHGVRASTEVQSQMTAVERILEYTDLPKEESTEPDDPPPPNWPSLGRIQFQNVFMSYAKDEPAVLKNLNLTIEPGWKVGVVGRTGAGKSSLIQALFRLTGDGLQGQILIDNVDIKTVCLQHLRSNISIIPQEPVLFSESLRYNLDPFNKYPDDALWNALKEVELGGLTLDQMVTEGGMNFSVGERQLICLARAVLRNNRVLVLDEATANIDTRTDELIQRTIRTKFAECTVITIAHRLNTIIDSDRIIVMDGGRLVEFDTPYELLSRTPTSLFAKMAEQTGTTMAAKLLDTATSCHRRRNRSSSLGSLDIGDDTSYTIDL